ncbi:GNAT family N-acetyltransferase [Nitratireductor basaltis]|uniref:GCN5-related N-acetyltransferase n=1 Tax=Nitratireductor basaltis TaxID=472175 RepID=A0A084UDV6_9HYPH|nr:GNAT family N-acetyltransferase [Nitratireductor basaltis]KFB11142.1 GCN5-related N-acetyltransferase [Nitratireductor basaltis]
MTNHDLRSYRIELLDTERHDRSGFSCGVAAVDNFLKRTARKLSKVNNSRIYVMLDDEDRVIGYYALNAHAVDYTRLPARFARNRPSHGSIPAAFLSMIGVDQRYSGQGLGGELLVDALIRVARAAEHVGIAIVVLDVLDNGQPELVERRSRLYANYGFQPLPSDPMRMFLPVVTIHQLWGEN